MIFHLGKLILNWDVLSRSVATPKWESRKFLTLASWQKEKGSFVFLWWWKEPQTPFPGEKWSQQQKSIGQIKANYPYAQKQHKEKLGRSEAHAAERAPFWYVSLLWWNSLIFFSNAGLKADFVKKMFKKKEFEEDVEIIFRDQTLSQETLENIGSIQPLILPLPILSAKRKQFRIWKASGVLLQPSGFIPFMAHVS